jgi:tripartite-type tricarboxylate transporter receptor subunit TctC
MSTLRRASLAIGLAFSTLASLLTGIPAFGQAFPARALHVIVPYAPGGQTDVLARLVGNEMQRPAAQAVVIENKPGASGVVAVEYVVKAGADGYTSCFCTPTNIFMPPILDPATPYDPVKVLAPVIQLFDAAALFVARPGLAASSLKQVLEQARAHPHQVTFGSIGTGTHAPYPVELLVNMSGADFNMVSYKGEQPVMTDLLADRVDVGYLSVPSALPQIKAGKAKALAAIAPSRIAGLPDTPTVTETLPGYEATVFFGLFVPAGTPRPAIDKLNEIAAAATNTPVVQERLKAEALYPVAGKPDAFAARVHADGERWNKLMK